MVFSTLLFLFRFMTITFTVYYLTPRKYKNLVIFIASLIFYSWGEVKYFPLMLASVVVDYTASNLIEKNRDKSKLCKVALWASIIFNLGMLGYFKYTNFFIGNINSLFGADIDLLSLTLPLGISFYTFQTMSYTIDVYRNKVSAEKNIVNFAAFVVLFPQLIAGPIVRYTDIHRELNDRTVNLGQIQAGLELFIQGIARKVLIANSVGSLWTEVETMAFTTISTPLAWLAVLAFGLQIYFDFSGYSLMAIGLGKMLGFDFPQNFNNPYISRSATEFWRRWHITLGSWFREYVYIPLGGNRCSKARNMFNLFAVWAVTGFWHGASWNFVLWGLFFFVLITIEKFFLLKHLEKSQVFSRLYLLPLILLSWALFAITDFTRLGEYFTAMLTMRGGTDWQYYLRNYGFVLAIGCLFSTPIVSVTVGKFPVLKKLQYPTLFALLIFSIAYLVDATYNPFLYWNF